MLFNAALIVQNLEFLLKIRKLKSMTVVYNVVHQMKYLKEILYTILNIDIYLALSLANVLTVSSVRLMSDGDGVIC